LILVSGFSLSLPAPGSDAESALTVPAWAFAAAAILALVPAAAILPKFAGDAVQLADPIFDHAKSAMIDAMARLGLPPVNPVLGNSARRGVLPTTTSGISARPRSPSHWVPAAGKPTSG